MRLPTPLRSLDSRWSGPARGRRPRPARLARAAARRAATCAPTWCSPGETATELAVRYHAWTAELIAHNHLGPSATLHAGQRLEIPVVRVRGPRPEAFRGGRGGAGPARAPRRRPVPRPGPTTGSPGSRVVAGSTPSWRWRSRGRRPAGRCTTSPSAGAIGAMQVLPSTADWMEYYVGRRLHPRRLHDNAVTGVTLLRVLADHTRIAAAPGRAPTTRASAPSASTASTARPGRTSTTCWPSSAGSSRAGRPPEPPGARRRGPGPPRHAGDRPTGPRGDAAPYD